jgi:chemotaxis-related protein WspB
MALFLKIQTGTDIYLLEAAQVDRVIPALELKKLPGTGAGIAGIINYQGTPVPVLDVCELFLGRPAVRHLSTRVILMRVPEPAPVEAVRAGRLVGLLAEKVMDTIRLAPQELIAGIRGEHTRYLGGMARLGGGLGQRIVLDELLDARRLEQLFRSTEAAA